MITTRRPCQNGIDALGEMESCFVLLVWSCGGSSSVLSATTARQLTIASRQAIDPAGTSLSAAREDWLILRVSWTRVGIRSS